jgi:hypothetical protein
MTTTSKNEGDQAAAASVKKKAELMEWVEKRKAEGAKLKQTKAAAAKPFSDGCADLSSIKGWYASHGLPWSNETAAKRAADDPEIALEGGLGPPAPSAPPAEDIVPSPPIAIATPVVAAPAAPTTRSKTVVRTPRADGSLSVQIVASIARPGGG